MKGGNDMFRKIFSVFSVAALIFYFSNPIQAADDDLDEFDDIVEVELNLDDDVDDSDDDDLDEFYGDKEAEKLDGNDMVKQVPEYDDDDYFDDDEDYSEPVQPAQPSNYVRVAVIIDTPGGTTYEPDAVYNSTKKLMKNVLESQPGLQMLPIENVDAYVQIYREENDIDVPAADGFPAQVKPALKRANLNELGDFLKAKYIFYIRITSSAPQKSSGIFIAGKRANASTDFRIWSQDKKNFVYAKRYMATAASNTYLAWFGGSSYNAVSKGVKKAFSKIEADLPQLQAAIRN